MESLSLELMETDHECEDGMIAERNIDPPGAGEAFSKQLVTCCWESIDPA